MDIYITIIRDGLKGSATHCPITGHQLIEIRTVVKRSSQLLEMIEFSQFTNGNLITNAPDDATFLFIYLILDRF